MRNVFPLAKDNRGIAAVEFAFIAPVLVLLICGFMEFSHVSSARTRLEGATMRAARAVAASDCPAEREGMMRGIITQAMEGIPSPGGGAVEIETRSYSDQFGNVGEPEPFDDQDGNSKWDEGEPYNDVNGNGNYDKDMGKLGSIGAAGEVVSYTARFRVFSIFRFVNTVVNGSGVYDIEASTVMRNEPIFSSTGCT